VSKAIVNLEPVSRLDVKDLAGRIQKHGVKT
jgi:hypothetical protein